MLYTIYTSSTGKDAKRKLMARWVVKKKWCCQFKLVRKHPRLLHYGDKNIQQRWYKEKDLFCSPFQMVYSTVARKAWWTSVSITMGQETQGGCWHSGVSLLPALFCPGPQASVTMSPIFLPHLILSETDISRSLSHCYQVILGPETMKFTITQWKCLEAFIWR